MFLEPWCTKDPRTCAKYLGIIELVLSVVGLIILLCLPLLILNLESEVQYIQADKAPKTDFSKTPSPNHTLVVDNSYGVIECGKVATNMKTVFDNHLNKIKNATLRPSYWIGVNSSIKMGNDYSCIHVVCTNVNPSTTVYSEKINETLTVQHTMKSILIEAIKANTNQNEAEIESKITEVKSGVEQGAKQYLYPGAIGDDPERRKCIAEIVPETNKEEAQALFDWIYNWLLASAIFSFATGMIFMAFGSSWMGKCLVLTSLVMELICMVPLLIVFFMINDPKLCLLQYGGISGDGKDSPKHLQTIITYTCGIYVVAFKGYSLVFLTALYFKANKLPRRTNSQASSTGATIHSDINLLEEEEELEREVEKRRSEDRYETLQQIILEKEKEKEAAKANAGKVEGVGTTGPPQTPEKAEEKKKGGVGPSKSAKVKPAKSLKPE